jgi:hypothetical protein
MLNPEHFRDAFEKYLISVLSGQLGDERQRLFIEWLEAPRPFVCNKCVDYFDVSASEVGENDLILCQKCRKADAA